MQPCPIYRRPPPRSGRRQRPRSGRAQRAGGRRPPRGGRSRTRLRRQRPPQRRPRRSRGVRRPPPRPRPRCGGWKVGRWRRPCVPLAPAGRGKSPAWRDEPQTPATRALKPAPAGCRRPPPAHRARIEAAARRGGVRLPDAALESVMALLAASMEPEGVWGPSLAARDMASASLVRWIKRAHTPVPRAPTWPTQRPSVPMPRPPIDPSTHPPTCPPTRPPHTNRGRSTGTSTAPPKPASPPSPTRCPTRRPAPPPPPAAAAAAAAMRSRRPAAWPRCQAVSRGACGTRP